MWLRSGPSHAPGFGGDNKYRFSSLLASCRLGTLAIRFDSKGPANLSVVVYQLISCPEAHGMLSRFSLVSSFAVVEEKSLVEEAPCDVDLKPWLPCPHCYTPAGMAFRWLK